MLADLQRRLADALLSADPVGAWSAQPDRAVSEDGLRIAAMLVAKLRFERCLRGSRYAAEAFAHDPATFASAFRRYHLTTPPAADSVPEEGERFDRWWEAVVLDGS